MDRNIRGITIEIDGDTSGLSQALKNVDKDTKGIQTELKQVEGLLKFDPSNVELLSQKQRLLGDAIATTSTRLDALKQAQSEVERQFQSGEIGEEAYRRFQREIIATEGRLRSFQSQADAVRIRLDAQVDVSGLDRMRQNLEDVAESAKKVGGQLKDVGKELSTSVSAPLVAFGGGALLAAGQFDDATGQIQSALGVTADEAEKLEDRAKNVWKSGFGESLDEVSNALIRVKQNMHGISDDDELEKVTKDAMALAKTFDSDVVEVTRAANNMMTNFGISSEEAFDLMAKGAQNGLNFSNEMFDNLAEYSPLFADLNFSAEDMFGTLISGAKEGVYNLDYLNDMIKEYGIRLFDGSDKTKNAMSSIFSPDNLFEFGDALKKNGQNTKEFIELVDIVGETHAKNIVENLGKTGKAGQDAWADLEFNLGRGKEILDGVTDGSISGQDAMTEIAKAIALIEDPIARTSLGVELFGTKFEDLGTDASLAMLTAGQSLEDYGGAMEGVVKAQEETFGQRWSNLVRSSVSSLEPLGKILLDFAEQWLPKIIAFVELLATWFSNLAPIIQILIVAFGAILAALGPFLVIVGAIIGAIGQFIPIVLKVVDAFSKFGTATSAITGPIGIAILAIVAIGTALVVAYNKVDWFRDGVNNLFGKIKDVTMTVFTSIKDTIVSLISSAIDFAKDLLTKFKSFWDENGQAIVGFVKLYFGLIKTNIEMVMGIIKGIFETVFPLISGVVKVAFELMKFVIKTTLDIVLGIISGVMKLIQGDWSGAWSQIEKIVVNIWNNIKSFFEKVDLEQVGKDIIQGLIDGITTMGKAVWDAVKTIAEGVSKTVMKVLGISSPSKVFRQIGLWTGEGLAIGIEESEGTVKNATESMVNGILTATKTYQAEYKALQDSFDKDRATKNEQVLAKIQKIEQTAAKKKRSLTKQERAEISKLENEHRDGKLKSEQDFNKKYQALVAKSEKEYLAIMTQSLEEQKANYSMTSFEEARYWENLIEMFTEGSVERLKVTQNYNKAVDDLNKELQQIEQNHVAQIKAIDDELVKNIQDVTKEYEDAVTARTSKLDGFASLFQEFAVDMGVSGYELTNNLRSQVEAFQLWETTIASLFGRGIISDGLENELSDLGVSALPQLLALNSMTDQQLTEYSNLFDTRSKQARTRAEQELIGMKFDTAIRIEEMKIEANKKLDEVNKSWDEQVKKLTATTRTELGNLNQIGVDAGQGLLNGLASMESPLINKARQIANAISATIASALQIKSPSRLTEKFGINIGQGLIVGMDEMISKVSQSSARLSSAVSGVYGSLSKSAKQSSSISSVANSTSTVNNTPVSNVFNVTIDAKNVKEFNDIVKLIQGIPQTSRAF